MNTNKKDVHDFWNNASCGEDLYLSDRSISSYIEQKEKRYELEPYIRGFADFESSKNKKVLEVGVGLGADHQGFAEHCNDLYGIDLTNRAIEHVKNRFNQLGLTSNLKTGDAEALDFPDNNFDIVYSWGVIHHSPNTAKAASEIMRVLKPGGEFRVLVYHKYSLVGFMLWVRYALLKGKINTSLEEIYSKYLESPGTKAYTVNEGKDLFKGASKISVKSQLCFGDLLIGPVGQRHGGVLLRIVKTLYPRPLIRVLFKNYGLGLLIKGTK